MDTAATRSVASRWDADDRLALLVAQAVVGGVGAAYVPPTQRRSGHDIARVLQAHGLLTLTDPNWPFLPLGDVGRRELRAMARLHGITGLTRVRPAAVLRDALAAAGIPAIFLKGIFLSQQVWGSAGARGAGDIDVLVRPEDLVAAVRAIESIGGILHVDTADLRPRPMDRRMHHGLSFDYAGTEIDLHYRLDDIPSVMAVPFAELQARSVGVTVGGEFFRTLDPVDALIATANHGGRDVWPKWGMLADFVRLLQRVESPIGEVVGRAKAVGVGHRLEVALALGRLLDPTLPEQSPWAEWIAGRVFRAHVRGTANCEDSGVTRVPGARLVLKVGSVARADTVTWAAWRLLWTGDAVGRNASDGAAEALVDAGRAVLAKAPRPGRSAGEPPVGIGAIAPAPHLAALVDGAADGVLDLTAFAPLDAALRDDRLSAEDLRVLPLLSSLMTRELPDHAFVGIVEGLRRRTRFQVAAAEGLTASVGAACALVGVPVVVLGDLGAARTLARQPGDRQVSQARVAVPGRVGLRTVREVTASAATASGAAVLPGRASAIERYGIRVDVGRSISMPFAFPDARSAIWKWSEPRQGNEWQPRPELVLFDSITRSSLGAPRIQWYADAVAARERNAGVDWGVLWQIGRDCGWESAVAEALTILRARGWDVPPPPRAPRGRMDGAYRRRRLAGAHTPRQRLALRGALAARLVSNSVFPRRPLSV